MSENSSKTVAQLKELLKEKGLSTAGVKSDLVSRLEEAEKSSEEAQPVTEQAEDSQDIQEPQGLQQPPEESKESELEAASKEKPSVPEPLGNAEETAEKPAEEPPKTLSADEIKALALESLEKKAARAKKFGDEQGAKDAEKEIKRVEKFGLELNSALARDLGLAPPEKKSSQFKNKFRSKNKSRR